MDIPCVEETVCSNTWNTICTWINCKIYAQFNLFYNSLNIASVKSSMHVYVQSYFSRVQLFATPWTVAHQPPPSMGLPRQEYWIGLPCSPPGDLPYPGTKPTSLTSPALAGRFFTITATWESKMCHFFEKSITTTSDYSLTDYNQITPDCSLITHQISTPLLT